MFSLIIKKKDVSVEVVSDEVQKTEETVSEVEPTDDFRLVSSKTQKRHERKRSLMKILNNPIFIHRFGFLTQQKFGY